MKNDDIKTVHVLIKGRVQGVFFRGSTRSMAESLGLNGYVRNLPNGDVEALFQGPASAVKQAVNWCRKGPPTANVSSVGTNWLDTADIYDSFIIRR